MADMTGTVLSNRFRVNDVERFRSWLGEYFFGSHRDTELRIIDPCATTGKHMVYITASEHYPNAWPQTLAAPDEDDYQEEVQVDLATWAAELREHLHEGDVFHLVAGGNERERCVGYTELAIDHRGHAFQIAHSDDDEGARALIARANANEPAADDGAAGAPAKDTGA